MLLVLVEVPYHPFYLLMKKNQNDITSNLLDLKRKENPWKQTTFLFSFHPIGKITRNWLLLLQNI